MPGDSTSLEKVVLGLYGCGGFAREVMPLVREYGAALVRSNPRTTCKIYFMETEPARSELNGVPVISEEKFFEIDCSERRFNIAIADSKVRKRLADGCIAKGAKPMSLVAANVIIYDFNDIGEGAIICANSMITSNAKIGKFFHSNIYSYVAHDCVVGDFVTFGPSVHCNGNVHVQDHAYIGTGTVLRQGTDAKPIVIGEGALVGMGAVVVRDVPPNVTVIGNPAKLLKK